MAFETWCPRGCSPFREPVNVEAIRFEVVDGLPPPYDKAGTVDKTKQIKVDRAWWAARSLREKHAILAHEHGHMIGMDCEDCCDRHAGFLMARWGYTVPAIQGAFGFVTRPDRMGAGERAAQGARYSTTASASGAGVDAVISRQASLASRLRGAATSAPAPTTSPGAPTQRANPLPVAVPPSTDAGKVTITDPSFAPSVPVDPSIVDQAQAALDDATAHPRATFVGAGTALFIAGVVFVVIYFGRASA